MTSIWPPLLVFIFFTQTQQQDLICQCYKQSGVSRVQTIINLNQTCDLILTRFTASRYFVSQVRCIDKRHDFVKLDKVIQFPVYWKEISSSFYS